MTVSEGTAKLFEWFSVEQKFNFDEDMEKILSKAKKSEKAAIKCALEEFEKLEIVKSTEIKNEKYWVLNKNFETFGQDVKISPKTSLLISQLVNGFCDTLGVKDEESDPTSITEQDINNLLLICYHLINETDTDTDTEIEEKVDPSKN